MQAGNAESRQVRVILADDSWHYAQALGASLRLEPDIDVVAIAESAEELLELVATHTPDVALVDLDLPEMGGVAACRALRDTHADVGVVVVTQLTDPDIARQCVALGARAYVVKHDRTDPTRAAEAIRSAARGDHLFDRELHQLLRDLAGRNIDPAREAGLTARELEVLPFISEGLLNKEIAARLGLSEQTVKNHLNSMFRKLNARTRTELVSEARRRRILP